MRASARRGRSGGRRRRALDASRDGRGLRAEGARLLFTAAVRACSCAEPGRDVRRPPSGRPARGRERDPRGPAAAAGIELPAAVGDRGVDLRVRRASWSSSGWGSVARARTASRGPDVPRSPPRRRSPLRFGPEGADRARVERAATDREPWPRRCRGTQGAPGAGSVAGRCGVGGRRRSSVKTRSPAEKPSTIATRPSANRAPPSADRRSGRHATEAAAAATTLTSRGTWRRRAPRVARAQGANGRAAQQAGVARTRRGVGAPSRAGEQDVLQPHLADVARGLVAEPTGESPGRSRPGIRHAEELGSHSRPEHRAGCRAHRAGAPRTAALRGSGGSTRGRRRFVMRYGGRECGRARGARRPRVAPLRRRGASAARAGHGESGSAGIEWLEAGRTDAPARGWAIVGPARRRGQMTWAHDARAGRRVVERSRHSAPQLAAPLASAALAAWRQAAGAAPSGRAARHRRSAAVSSPSRIAPSVPSVGSSTARRSRPSAP